MVRTDTIELFPFGQDDFQRGRITPTKSTVILIRWTVVIICAYLIIYRAKSTISSDLLNLLVALYMGTNVALYSIKEEMFRRPAFHSSLLAQLPHCFGQWGEDRYRKSFILFKGLL